MSSRYLFHFNCQIRRDSPPVLHEALFKRAQGLNLSEEDVAPLPATVQSYLLGTNMPESNIYLYRDLGPRRKYVKGQLVEVEYEPHEGSHQLRMIKEFHDDEYFNYGIAFIFWIYSQIATVGTIGTMQEINGNNIPSILFKPDRDHVVETSLFFRPGEHWPAPKQQVPDLTDPIFARDSLKINIQEIIEGMAQSKET